MIRLALPLIAVAAIGCAHAEPPESAQMRPGAAPCSDKKVQRLVGRLRSDKVAAEAKRLSGAMALRWVRPGMMVTMDYREDRLNLHIDAKGKILSASCG